MLAAIGHGGLKEGQVVNRLLEEYEKDHKKEITDENILEKISEANKQKVHIARSKSGIVVKGINSGTVGTYAAIESDAASRTLILINSTDWGKALAGNYSATITFTAEVVSG